MGSATSLFTLDATSPNNRLCRFVANLRRKKQSQPKKKLPIQVSELNEAAEFWFRSIQ